MNALSGIDVAAELRTVEKHWTPRVVGRVNDQYVKVAKLLGELVWHAHDDEDEMFLVVSGRLRIQLEGDVEVVLEPGQFHVVPRGVRIGAGARLHLRPKPNQLHLFDPAGRRIEP